MRRHDGTRSTITFETRLSPNRLAGEIHSKPLDNRPAREIGIGNVKSIASSMEVVLAWLKIEFPARHLSADVLLLLFLDKSIAKVADVDLIPPQLLRPGFEIRLHVAK